MSKMNLAEKVKLASIDEMFGLTEENTELKQNAEKSEDQVIEVPLSELHTFKNHPFRVLDDEKMDETVESIKEYGVLSPGVARRRAEGGYEILSGHRRKRACELAGLKTMPMLIKQVSDDEAIEIMVDSNIQREDILPSEKAKAYAMKSEALKHRGKSGGKTTDLIGEMSGENGKTVQRFIQLSRLSSSLLDLVDEKKIGVTQGADLSFLNEEAQNWVYETIMQTNCSISGVQSAVIKAKYKEGKLTAEQVWDVLNKKKPVPRKIVFNSKRLDSYFTPDYSNEEIEELIISLLENWKAEKGGEA